MAEPATGLRFDIYERVHLAEHSAGIKELDEVELVPHIQVQVEEEQAVLKGNLWLTGTYSGEGEMRSLMLEHLIPVEITLPMNRIERLEDIAVEIENFDIDILSERTLNVTGVLSLKGLELRSAEGEQSFSDEEEVVFIHQPAEVRAEEHAAQPAESAADDAAQAEAAQEMRQPAVKRIFPEDIWVAPKKEAANGAEAGENTLGEEQVEEEWLLSELNDGESEPAGAMPFLEEPAVPAIAQPKAEEESGAEEKKEPKVAFGSKSAPGIPNAEENPFKSLLHSIKEPRNPSDPAANAQVQESGGQPQQGNDALEWKKLFLGGEQEGSAFKRVRMCIVQKEDTLEKIAERYRINPREIALFNRLSGQDIAVGQVIRIPHK